MKKIVLLAWSLVAVATAHAQDKIEATISGDFVSSYIWRGLDAGSAAVQPTLGVGYKGLSLSAWGSYGLTDPDDVKEFDLTLAYAASGFNIGITDYWFSAGLDPDARYFKYDAHGTNHIFEANVGYDFGFASLQWYTNFAGNDGENKSGKRAYSSYVEASPLRHLFLRHDGLRRYQPLAAGYEGHQDHRFVLNPALCPGDRQPLLAEGIPGSWIYAASLIFTRSYKNASR